MNFERIVLIGYRGTGKTTLAAGLSQHLKWSVVSTDKMIEQYENMTIREIVEQFDWSYFRYLESLVIKQLKLARKVIIDCGGGVVENVNNMNYLQKNAFIIWVDAHKKDILNRILLSGERPLLSEDSMEKDIEKNYEGRISLYKRYSHFYLNTSQISTEQGIIMILKNSGLV